MFSFLKRMSIVASCFMVLGLYSALLAQAAMNPAFELDPQVLGSAGVSAKKTSTTSFKKLPARSSVKRAAPESRKRSARHSQSRHAHVTVQALQLEAPAMDLSEQETSARVTSLWNALVPQATSDLKPLNIRSSMFSLSLDPQRYPMYNSLDGARVVVDRMSSIPPLIKSLITEQEPSVRIVSESSLNKRQFLSAMLNAAGFYSVEDNFSVDFGTDPRLQVRADFKVEKTSESLINQDVVLLNSGRVSFPRTLTSFLKKEGFTVYEPFASEQAPLRNLRTQSVYQITSKNRIEVVDAILSVLSIGYNADRHVDVFAGEENGISLSVKAHRYVEREGQRCIVTLFDGNPITYTLFRILETKGYRVVILEEKDDFRKISEKLLASLRIPFRYKQHEMWPDGVANYSLWISGFRLNNTNISGNVQFLTDSALVPAVRDLLVENGYDVRSK